MRYDSLDDGGDFTAGCWGEPHDYERRHPAGADALLVVEVARTSQALDRRKARIFAAAGVPVYWLVDVVKRRLEVFSHPSESGAFAQRRTLGPGDNVELPGLAARMPVSSPVFSIVG